MMRWLRHPTVALRVWAHAICTCRREWPMRWRLYLGVLCFAAGLLDIAAMIGWLVVHR